MKNQKETIRKMVNYLNNEEKKHINTNTGRPNLTYWAPGRDQIANCMLLTKRKTEPAEKAISCRKCGLPR